MARRRCCGTGSPMLEEDGIPGARVASTATASVIAARQVGKHTSIVPPGCSFERSIAGFIAPALHRMLAWHPSVSPETGKIPIRAGLSATARVRASDTPAGSYLRSRCIPPGCLLVDTRRLQAELRHQRKDWRHRCLALVYLPAGCCSVRENIDFACVEPLCGCQAVLRDHVVASGWQLTTRRLAQEMSFTASAAWLGAWRRAPAGSR